MCLGDKKHAAQGVASATPTTLTLGLATNSTLPKPESSSTSLSITLVGCIFTNTQAYDMYKEFLNADDKI